MEQFKLSQKPYMRSHPADYTASCVSEDGHLAGFTLETLRDRFSHDFFDEYLPYLEMYAVDREYGGFMCNSHADGTRVDTNKRAWYEGRGLWLYSYLYNKLGDDQGWLETARKTANFILKLKPEGNTFWPGTYTRDGAPLSAGAHTLTISPKTKEAGLLEISTQDTVA